VLKKWQIEKLESLDGWDEFCDPHQWEDFEDARTFVRTLKLKNQKEWLSYASSGKRPTNIPSTPRLSFKDQWQGLADWLGTNGRSFIKKNIWPLEKAREFAQSLKLKSRREWEKYCKLGKKPNKIPAAPQHHYKNKGWVDWGDFLGYPTSKGYWPLERAKDFIHTLELKNYRQWLQYCKSGKKPKEIPSDPQRIYEDKWINTGDWLGNGNDTRYLSFEDARPIVHSLNIKSYKEWQKLDKKDIDRIPRCPHLIYKESGWVSWPDWFGTDFSYYSFEEARDFVHSLKLDTKGDCKRNWLQYCRSGKKPKEMPICPSSVYKESGWVSWPDWLGKEVVGFCPFEEARNFVHSLELSTRDQWTEYCKSRERPKNIPASPYSVYENEWVSWPDWLKC